MEPLSHLVVYIGLDHYLGVTPRETRLTDRLPVRRLVVLEQPVGDQKFNAALAYLNRRNHGYTPGAALAQASCTDNGCRFMGHVTG
jgi:hypothetical protein